MNKENEIIKLYKELGRDPSKLKIKNKTKEELNNILEKLKAIKYSFGLLFSEQQGIVLAKEVLNSIFKKEDGKNIRHK